MTAGSQAHTDCVTLTNFLIASVWAFFFFCMQNIIRKKMHSSKIVYGPEKKILIQITIVHTMITESMRLPLRYIMNKSWGLSNASTGKDGRK